MSDLEGLDVAQTSSRIAPLLGRREPIVGESLMSVVARASAASGFRNLSTVLGSIGMIGVPDFVPFTQAARAADLAALLRVDPHEVRTRMHPGSRDVIDWWGESTRRLFLEAGARRYSPSSLRWSEHHRASWMIRALPFCPESFDILRSDCTSCGKALGWRYTAGIGKCEHCLADLTDAVVETVAVPERAAALRIANLMSSDPADRVGAIETLPAPFRHWHPSDAFEAIVELGVAQEKLSRMSAVGGGLIMGAGRYEAITTPVLLAGLDVVDQWPSSLAAIVDTVARSTNVGGSTALSDCLGPLNKFMRQHRAGFPLVDAMAGELATAFRAARIPIKSTALKHCTPAEDGLISEKEALEAFDVYQVQLRRLDGVSDTLVMQRASVSKLYSRAALADAVVALKSSKTPPEIVRLLGVPEFMLDAFGRCGLLELERNRDAILMSGSGRLFSDNSVTRLLQRVAALPVALPGRLQPLSHILRHVFSPEAWAFAMNLALDSGRAALERRKAPLVDRLMIMPEQVHYALRASSWSFPADVGVSCITAGRLIGQNDVLMSKAVAEGVIDSWKGPKRSHMISLADLFEFDRTFAFTNDIAELLGCSPQGAAKQMRAAGMRPAQIVYRMALWNRFEAETKLGLQSRPQHLLAQHAVAENAAAEATGGVSRPRNKLARQVEDTGCRNRGSRPVDQGSCHT